MTILPRSTWETATNYIDGPAPVKDWIHTRVYHFPGVDFPDLDFTNDGKMDLADLVSQVRTQNSYYRRERGYALGYCTLGDVSGHVVNARGLEFRCAANVGTRAKTGVDNFNPYSVAHQFVIDIGQQATPVQLEAAAASHVEIEKALGRELWVKGHRDVGDTTCPGKAYTQLEALRNLIIKMRVPIPPPPPPPDGIGTLLADGWYRLRADEWPYGVALKLYGTAMAWPILVEDNPTWMTGPRPEWIEVRNGVNSKVTSSVITHVRSGETLSQAMRRAFPAIDDFGGVAGRIGPTCVWSGIDNPNLVFPNQLISIPTNWSAP